MKSFEQEEQETKQWMASSRFQEITRLYSAHQVVEQRGAIAQDFTVAQRAAEGFYQRLRELHSKKEQITTFGPYSPGQAVVIKRMGIEGIYLGGWATSAKGSISEDPGPDLASYPLSQVPEEAAVLVRALLAADRNQEFARSRMSDQERAASPRIDYRPFIIADADTGHGGEAHVRNLIRRFVEAGVPGYHIEDQKPGTKKCGHQGGKVLVPVDEQLKRLNAARFQLDVMRVPGIIVARTDAEAANLLDGMGDERDHPFILGATDTGLPAYRIACLAVLKRFYDQGMEDVKGHFLYRISDGQYQRAMDWLEKAGALGSIDALIEQCQLEKAASLEASLDSAVSEFHQIWEAEADLKTFGEAVADRMTLRAEEGANFDLSPQEWLEYSKTVSLEEAEERAQSMGLNVIWDCEMTRTPEGYYQVRGGIEYAIAKSLAAAPFADLLWMETKTADLEDARQFADAIQVEFPEKMLAYNLSPSFNWDTTGMTDEEMRDFPKELGKLGYVFNFITYGGHQIDGLAAEDFATALRQDGMLTLARLQRKFRLLDSPYRTPQTLVGGPRLDAALAASSGRTATTKAMGKGSTQRQHLVETEVPPKLLEGWLKLWAGYYQISEDLRVCLKPFKAGSDLLKLSVLDSSEQRIADIVFTTIHDRKGRPILSVRDQNTLVEEFRKKRLMTLIHLFVIHRYKSTAVHYLSPTADNLKQTEGMNALGIYDQMNTQIEHIIVAGVNPQRISELLNSDQVELKKLIFKQAASGVRSPESRDLVSQRL